MSLSCAWHEIEGSPTLWIHSQAFVKHVYGGPPGGVHGGLEFAEWAAALDLPLVPDKLPFMRLAPRVRQPSGHLGT